MPKKTSKPTRSRKPAAKTSIWQHKLDIRMVVFILVFVALGTYFLIRSRANQGVGFKLAQVAANLTTGNGSPRVVRETSGNKRNADVVLVDAGQNQTNHVYVTYNATDAGTYKVCGFGRRDSGGTAKLYAANSPYPYNATTLPESYIVADYPVTTGTDYKAVCTTLTLVNPGTVYITDAVTSGSWRFSVNSIELLEIDNKDSKNPIGKLPKIDWEGGSTYYNQFSAAKSAGWSSPTFFPVGAWFLPADTQNLINTYKSMGFNLGVNQEVDSDVQRLNNAGIFVLPENYNGPAVGNSVPGWVLRDEADMKGGFPVLQEALDKLPKDQAQRFRYANFAKGVLYWETDEDAAKYVNNYTQVVSVDAYWYTDNDSCKGIQGPSIIKGSGPIPWPGGNPELTQAECHRAWNYGQTVERIHKLDATDGKLQPVWVFVEVGYPGGWGLHPTGPQIEGAVMSSLIHEARGILYFKHNFDGPCKTTDIFRDCASTAPIASLTNINGHIKDLAPVLNTQSYKYSFGSDIDSMLKWYDGAAYVFAMGDQGKTGTKTFTLPNGLAKAKSVQVLYENRNLSVSNGRFTDNFQNEYSYHIYKIIP